MTNVNESKTREWVINSHRGAFHEGLLENTTEAFTGAYKEGANCLECDLHLTRDKQIVLIHNDELDGFSTLAEKIPDEAEFHERPEGKVRTHTLAYLQAIRFPRGAHLLSLPEFLALLKELHIGANIELKESGYERLILKAIEDARVDFDALLGPVVCTGSNIFAILRLVRWAPQYNIPLYRVNQKKGLAMGFQALEPGAFYGKWMIRQMEKRHMWGFMTHYRHLPISCIPYAHQHGIKFCPRVPDDAQLVNQYIEAGADGFETDYVPFIRQCIEAKGHSLWPLPK